MVRDTKDRGVGPVPRIASSDWHRFTRGIKQA